MIADGPQLDAPADPDEEALAEFLERAFTRFARGESIRPAELLLEAPHLVPKAEQLLADVEELFEAMVGVRSASRSLGADAEPVASVPDYFPGEFLALRLLGQGSFGQVWLADDLHLGRRVALKVIRPGNDSTLVRRRLAHLRDEARLLAAVRHPNVVTVYAWREAVGDGGTPLPVMVQRYVPGGSLAERVQKSGPIPWAAAGRYVADVADGLIAVHAAGVIHRDVKPANVLWDPEVDEAVLTDFGISTRMTDGPPGGTLSFMPPEAFEGKVSPAQDTYGLAATLFWLLTGEVPFPGLTTGALASQARRGLPEPDPRCSGVPARVERIIRIGLAPQPENRPTVTEFATRLRGALNQALADTLAPAPGNPMCPGPRITVSRQTGTHSFRTLTISRPEPGNLLRDLTRVPPEPEQATATTGERIRIEVEPHAAGFLTVFNVGPTGNLTVLFPDSPEGELRTPGAVTAGVLIRILDVALAPPAGEERIVAVWTRELVPLRSEELRYAADGADLPPASSYRATRDIKKIQDLTAESGSADRRVVVLTLRHLPVGGLR